MCWFYPLTTCRDNKNYYSTPSWRKERNKNKSFFNNQVSIWRRRNEGFIQLVFNNLGLFSAVDTTVVKSTISCGVKIGMFRYFTELCRTREDRNMKFGEKIGVSSVSGLVASLLTNPLDIVSLETSASQDSAKWKRPRYKNFISSLYDIYKDSGFLGFYKGLLTNILRKTVSSVSQLVSYHTCK